MATLKWLADVVRSRRTPHWFFLAVPSLAAAIGLYAFADPPDLSGMTMPVEYQVVALRLAVAAALFLALFTGMLMYFNGRAVSTRYPIIVDQDGALRYEQELHIALRVDTLKNLVSSLATKIKKDEDVKRILFESGEFAGADFGRKFPQIYLRELKGRERDTDWAKLSRQAKFDLWREWDRGVGWGVFSTVDEGDKGLTVQNHHVSMYSEPGGRLIATMLSGYVAGVVREVAGQDVRIVGDPVITSDNDSMIVRLNR